MLGNVIVVPSVPTKVSVLFAVSVLLFAMVNVPVVVVIVRPYRMLAAVTFLSTPASLMGNSSVPTRGDFADRPVTVAASKLKANRRLVRMSNEVFMGWGLVLRGWVFYRRSKQSDGISMKLRVMPVVEPAPVVTVTARATSGVCAQPWRFRGSTAPPLAALANKGVMATDDSPDSLDLIVTLVAVPPVTIAKEMIRMAALALAGMISSSVWDAATLANALRTGTAVPLGSQMRPTDDRETVSDARMSGVAAAAGSRKPGVYHRCACASRRGIASAIFVESLH